jgi:hypothetical protein
MVPVGRKRVPQRSIDTVPGGFDALDRDLAKDCPILRESEPRAHMNADGLVDIDSDPPYDVK